MEPIDAREWGRRQAEASPVWSEEKWRRVGAILGVELLSRDVCDPAQAQTSADESRAA